MLSMIVDRDGSGLAMRLAELPDPACPPGYVVVAVEAAGVNPVDVGNAADSSWAMVDSPYVVGYEFAGSVAANGTTSEPLRHGRPFRVGEAVWGLLPARGTRWGAYSEKIAVPADLIAARPPELTVAQAAAVPLAGGTALQVLDRLRLASGSWLLVHGAAGGVGHLLVQLAVARGLRVAAAARAGDRARMEALGVELWLDRDAGDSAAQTVARLGRPVDGVADLVGGGLLQESLPHVAEGGQAATIVNFDGDFEEAIDRNITVHGVLVRAGYQVLDRLSGAVRDGLRPTLSGTWPLAEALTAHKRLAEGRVGGKLVLMVSGQVGA
jgi:NADPH:quinone reductase